MASFFPFFFLWPQSCMHDCSSPVSQFHSHAAEDSVFSEISTCSDDGKTLTQQFFMNDNCEGQPQSDAALQQNHCASAANGMFYAYACRPAATQGDAMGEAKDDAMLQATGPAAGTLKETAAPWAVVRIEAEDNKNCVVSRIWNQVTGRGAPETFASGVCHAAEDSVFSEISTCSDDGKTLTQQFFMNPNCEGQPQSDAVLQQNHCASAANGMFYAYACRPAATKDDTIGEAKDGAMLQATGPAAS